MKLYCKHEYKNAPARLHFTPGVIEVDSQLAAFLLKDAPEGFSTDIPAAPVDEKGLNEPPSDKAVKKPAKKK